MNVFGRFLARLKFRRKIKNDESCNVVDSMVKARKLYKELSVAAHPDRHPARRDVAEDIMQRITANKHNYSALLALKGEIAEKLI
ncbi:MAG: hypothetical protein ACI30K_08205 [Muribaculaceae bacterium]